MLINVDDQHLKLDDDTKPLSAREQLNEEVKSGLTPMFGYPIINFSPNGSSENYAYDSKSDISPLASKSKWHQISKFILDKKHNKEPLLKKAIQSYYKIQEEEDNLLTDFT